MTHPRRIRTDEAGRLAALDDYAVLDTGPEREFDDLVRLAQEIFAVPIALTSFVAEDRQFFKASVGVGVCQTTREGSFCTRMLLGGEILIVPDAALDQRFAASPLVTGEPFVRFYAGAPLVTPDGFVIGSFCIKDTVPRRNFSAEQRETLGALARLVMQRLGARKTALGERDGLKRFESIAAVAPDSIICADGANRILFWNKAAEATFGYSAAEAVGQSLSIIVPPALRARHEAGLARAAAGQPHELVGSLVTVPACRRDGSEFPIELSLSHWTEAGEHRFGAILRDVTERQEQERRLKHEAESDHLTGIANRRVLNERMRAASRDGRSVALLLLDLDGFKDVNDSLGHAAGDEVLRAVARRLVAGAGEPHLVARLGGDEFTVLVETAADPIEAAALAERLVAAVERPVEVGERSVYVGASCGVATAGTCGWTPDDLLGDADLALYRAKADGRSRVRLFTPELRPVAGTRRSVSSNLREAWERREFEMHYQPQVRLADGTLAGAEALIRWNHPERGLVGPAAFLPALEGSLLAVPVSEWILRAACEQASRWRRDGLADFRVGVNLFAAQFRSGDLPDVVARALADFDLPAAALELEITENIILRSDERIDADLAALREIGVGIAFDDYGTGYASLTMLKDYPVTRLKIDRSFVSGVQQSRADRTIVAAIAKLAKGFALEVIAEGIETVEQAEMMRQYCAEGQGYLLGRPMPASGFAASVLGREGANVAGAGAWRHAS